MGLSVHDPFVDPLGNPLGLARTNAGDASNVSALLKSPAIVDFLGAASNVRGTYEVDKSAKFFRVTVVGAGGGGGGGLAQTEIIPVNGRSILITCVAASSTAYGLDGGTSTAKFLDFSLTSTGGKGPGNGYSGGMGSGGAYNFRGGAGAGGGAAGPRGNGGAGGTGYGGFGGEGAGGAGGGGGTDPSARVAGGGGVGAAGGAWTGQQAGRGGGSGLQWGALPSVGNGGAWGGGYGAISGYIGGAGGVRIEVWS